MRTFLLEPEALSADQIAALTRVDDQLGARAVSKRQAAQEKAAQARHTAAMGQPLAKKSHKEVAEDFAD